MTKKVQTHVKSISNIQSQYLTKNLPNKQKKQQIPNKVKITHRHNISQVQFQQKPSFENLHSKNLALQKLRHSQSLDKDQSNSFQLDNPFILIEKPQQKCYQSSLDYQSQTIDGRLTVNVFSVEKQRQNAFSNFQSVSQSVLSMKQQSHQHHQNQRFESYQKSRIFFTRFDGKGQDDYQEQEVHDFDSHYQAQENILDEENIPLRNRDSIQTMLKSSSCEYQNSISNSMENSKEYSSWDDEHKELSGVKTQKSSRHKFKSNYNSRNNKDPSCINFKRVSSETTVQNFLTLDTKLSAIREGHNTIIIQELGIKKKKVIQDKLRSIYGNKVSQIQRDMQDKLRNDLPEKFSDIKQQKQKQEQIQKTETESSIEKEIKVIKEFEFILQQFSNNQKQTNVLSVNDLGHALYLMKFFVAYPRNYANIKFTDGIQRFEMGFKKNNSKIKRTKKIQYEVHSCS
eukprot:403332052